MNKGAFGVERRRCDEFQTYPYRNSPHPILRRMHREHHGCAFFYPCGNGRSRRHRHSRSQSYSGQPPRRCGPGRCRRRSLRTRPLDPFTTYIAAVTPVSGTMLPGPDVGNRPEPRPTWHGVRTTRPPWGVDGNKFYHSPGRCASRWGVLLPETIDA